MPDARHLYALAERVGRELLARNARVVTAESCTGGWVAKALTDVPGSSQWFAEGYVAYSNRAKQRDLKVAASALRRHGAVSREVVRNMARGALQRSGAEVAVAVSGVAGPDGGTPAKPVGTVWFCWAVRHKRSVRLRTRKVRFRGDREAVRRRSVATALQGLLKGQ